MLKGPITTIISGLVYIFAVTLAFTLTALRNLVGLKDPAVIDGRRRKLVVISGCDSGLGLSMAKWAADAGYNVLAGCLSESGEGVEMLQKTENIFVETVNVTDKDSISDFGDSCRQITDEHGLELHAVIPNAAVSYPGEFFWLTEDQAKYQMEVNFWGAVNLVDAFQSQILEHKSRVIVIGSDCADYPLPGFAVYSATKAALQAWSKSIRLELAKYGVTVVNFQPGSFPNKSRLLCGQESNFVKMKTKLGEIGLIKFYSAVLEHFKNHYCNTFEKTKLSIAPLDDEQIKNAVFALLEDDVRKTPVYVYETSGQAIVHMIINIFPQFITDAVILKIMNSPKWNPVKAEVDCNKEH